MNFAQLLSTPAASMRAGPRPFAAMLNASPSELAATSAAAARVVADAPPPVMSADMERTRAICAAGLAHNLGRLAHSLAFESTMSVSQALKVIEAGAADAAAARAA